MTTLTLDAFAELLLSHPPVVALRAAEEMVQQGLAGRALYLEVLAPALRIVGSRWQAGLATVAQEHLATATVQAIMARVSPLPAELPPVGRRILLACTDVELHDVGLRMVGDFLEADGWLTYHLGASTPTRDLAALVERLQPDAVGLSTTLDTHLPLAKAAIGAIRATCPSVFVVAGGAAYDDDNDLARSFGADAVAADADRASRLLRDHFTASPVAAPCVT
jgi:methanogenic corrinoid protein MtbC1